MKGLLISLAMLAGVATVGAQDAAEPAAIPEGFPAKLEVAGGKFINVFLKGCDGEKMTFRVHKGKKDIPAPISKVKGLTFVHKLDSEAIKQAYIAADYQTVIDALAPVVEPRMQYMAVSNNLQHACVELMQAYRGTGNWEKVNEVASSLMTSSDPALSEKAKVYLALLELNKGDVAAVQRIQGELESEAAKMYLKGRIERLQGTPRVAFDTASHMIADFPNDMDWLPLNELMCAELYLDVGRTNSAIMTAKQVSNLYAGTHVAGDALKLAAGLEIVMDEQKEMEGTSNE